MLTAKDLHHAAKHFNSLHENCQMSAHEKAEIVADELALFESAEATNDWRYSDDDEEGNGKQREAASETIYTYVRDYAEPYLVTYFNKLDRQ